MIIKNKVLDQDFEPRGGLNTLADPFALKANESPKSIDVLHGEDNTLGKRYGREKLNATVTGVSDYCNGLFDYGVSPGVRKLVASFGTTFYKMDDLDGTFDSVESGRTDCPHYFERSGTKLILCNRNRDTIKYWDGSATSLTTLNADAPLAMLPKTFKGYFFLANTVANPRRIYYEDESTVTTGDYGEYFTLPSSSDDEVVALVEYNGRLYTSLRTEWYRISYIGGSAVFDYKKVSSVIGGVPNTIKVVSLPSVGEVIIYLGWNKRLYVFDGTSSYPISMKYEKDNGQSTVYLDAINQGGIEYSHATVDSNNDMYRLYVAIGENSTISHSFNISLSSMSCSVYQNQTFLASCMAEDSNKKRWHICGDYNGSTYRLDRRYIDEAPLNNVELGTDGSLATVEAYLRSAGPIIADCVHDGGDNVTLAEDATYNFTTEGVAVGDYIINKTDTYRHIITAINNGGGTNAQLDYVNTDNDTDDDDVFDVYKAAFIADDDSIYIGSAVKFDCINITLVQSASAAITPLVYYSSDAAGAYTALTVTDDTVGFAKTGNITYTLPSGWTKTNVDDGANAFADTETYYYIRIRRTANALTTTPKLSKITIGNRVNDDYVSPKHHAGTISELKKGTVGTLFFKPVAKYVSKFYDRKDFEQDWTSKDDIPMYNVGDDALGGNLILNSNKLGSRKDGIEWPIAISIVSNSYQYRINSNKAANIPWVLYKVEIAGKVLGIASSTNRIR